MMTGLKRSFNLTQYMTGAAIFKQNHVGIYTRPMYNTGISMTDQYKRRNRTIAINIQIDCIL